MFLMFVKYLATYITIEMLNKFINNFFNQPILTLNYIVSMIMKFYSIRVNANKAISNRQTKYTNIWFHSYHTKFLSYTF